jgi:hypothetical protein
MSEGHAIFIFTAKVRKMEKMRQVDQIHEASVEGCGSRTDYSMAFVDELLVLWDLSTDDMDFINEY